MCSCSAVSRRPRSTARCKDLSTRPRPASNSRSSTSTATTSTPPRAKTSAIPAPMVPRPTTPTVEICTAGSLSHPPTRLSPAWSPKARCVRLQPAQLVVVEDDAVDSALGGEYARLRLDLLRGEDSADRAQQGVAVEPLEVAGELLDPVDLAPPLDLDRDVAAVCVPAEQVDRADVGRVLASYEFPTGAQNLAPVGQQLLKVRFDPVLLQAWVDAEVVAGVAQHFVHGDHELLAALVGDGPAVVVDPQRAGWRYPHQRLVTTGVGVDEDGAIGFADEQADRGRQVRGEPAGVVHRAASDDQTHDRPTLCAPSGHAVMPAPFSTSATSHHDTPYDALVSWSGR